MTLCEVSKSKRFIQCIYLYFAVELLTVVDKKVCVNSLNKNYYLIRHFVLEFTFFRQYSGMLVGYQEVHLARIRSFFQQSAMVFLMVFRDLIFAIVC